MLCIYHCNLNVSKVCRPENILTARTAAPCYVLSMDYAAELIKLLQDKPELRTEAQRIFFTGATDVSTDDQPNVSTNSWERMYKALKSIADKQQIKA